MRVMSYGPAYGSKLFACFLLFLASASIRLGWKWRAAGLTEMPGSFFRCVTPSFVFESFQSDTISLRWRNCSADLDCDLLGNGGVLGVRVAADVGVFLGAAEAVGGREDEQMVDEAPAALGLLLYISKHFTWYTVKKGGC